MWEGKTSWRNRGSFSGTTRRSLEYVRNKTRLVCWVFCHVLESQEQGAVIVAVKKNLKFVYIEYENEKDDTLDTSSIKHEIRNFYVVASRPSRTGKERNVHKKAWCTCGVVVLLTQVMLRTRFTCSFAPSLMRLCHYNLSWVSCKFKDQPSNHEIISGQVRIIWVGFQQSYS